MRRVVLLLLALVLVGCGGQPQAPAATSAPAETRAVPTAEPEVGTTPAAGPPEATPLAIKTDPAVTATSAPPTSTFLATASRQTTPTAAAENAYPFTFTDATGVNLELEAQPRRIVSLFPANNETVFAIGAGDQVIAVDEFTVYPKAATEKPKIPGTYQKFDLERIVSLEPDLVLSSAGAEEVVDRPLRDAGIPVINTGYPATVQDVARHIRDLGKITGHTSRAEALAGRLEQTVETIRTQAAEAPKVRVYYEADISTPGKPYTVGRGSLVDKLITIAGGSNVFGEVNNPFPQVAYEAVVRQDPEVIVLGDVEGYVAPNFLNPTTVEDVKARPGFETIQAVKNDRVVPIDPDFFSTPGPRLIQGLKQFAAAIHPEIFGER